MKPNGHSTFVYHPLHFKNRKWLTLNYIKLGFTSLYSDNSIGMNEKIEHDDLNKVINKT